MADLTVSPVLSRGLGTELKVNTYVLTSGQISDAKKIGNLFLLGIFCCVCTNHGLGLGVMIETQDSYFTKTNVTIMASYESQSG